MSILMIDKRTNYEIHYMNSKSATVEYVDGTLYPTLALSKVIRGYSGIYTNDVPDDPNQFLNEIKATKLQTPYEMVSFIFLIKNVSRAFTHQLVRTRHASYVQESMRFLGAKKIYSILISNKVAKNDEVFDRMSSAYQLSIDTYHNLVENGFPAEDARGILPTNIMTSVFVGIPLSSLQRVYTQRLCCQAQEEWYHVVKEIKKCLVNEYGKEANEWLSAPVERGEPCGYNANFDRPCAWKNGVEGEIK